MDKKILRKQLLAARAALTPAQRQEKSRIILEKLKALLPAQSCILSYCASPEEVNLDGLPGAAYPRVIQKGEMEAFLPQKDWYLDRYGIRTPGADAIWIPPEEITLVLVPCVGFDAQCRRLGHGGGYYDRFLPRCKNARFLGIAFSVQELPQIPSEPHDFPLDGVLTENTLFSSQKNFAVW